MPEKAIDTLDFVLIGGSICTLILVVLLFSSGSNHLSKSYFTKSRMEEPKKDIEEALQKRLHSGADQQNDRATETEQRSLPDSSISTSNNRATTSSNQSSSNESRWKYIVIHHSGGDGGSVEQFDRIHRKKGIPGGITYHIVIGNGNGMEDGEVQVTRRWREHKPGPQTGIERIDEAAIGICVVGNFQHRSPSDRQIRSVQKVLAFLRRKFRISVDNIRGANEWEASQTLSPGKRFPMKELRSSLRYSTRFTDQAGEESG